MAFDQTLPGLTDVERDLAETAGRAGFRLRFDKVVVRLVRRLEAGMAEFVPEKQIVLFTVTAPIRRPGATAAAMIELARQGRPGTPVGGGVNGNDVRLRWVTGIPAHLPRAIGFVHRPGADALRLLDLAEERLAGFR